MEQLFKKSNAKIEEVSLKTNALDLENFYLNP